MKHLITAVFLSGLVLSSSAKSHGSHNHGVGAAGVVLNTVEAVKHVGVVVDQIWEADEDRSYFVLFGNAGVLVAHIVQAASQWNHISSPKKQHSKTQFNLFLLGNLWTLADLVVDGVTTTEYWQHRDGSLIAFAGKFLAPVCFGLNLFHLAKQYKAT